MSYFAPVAGAYIATALSAFLVGWVIGTIQGHRSGREETRLAMAKRRV